MSLCLRPLQDRRQKVSDFFLSVDPPAIFSQERDCFGNLFFYFDIHRLHHTLKIVMKSEVKVSAVSIPQTLPTSTWEKIKPLRESLSFYGFLSPSKYVNIDSKALSAFIAKHNLVKDADPLASLHVLNRRLYEILSYLPGSTSVDSSIDHILSTGRGVCQDYAHVMIAIARKWGIPARYVSGYMFTSGDTLEQSPENATHAWMECYLPTLGWIGFDPTNASTDDERHVRIGVGRDYADVPPTRGVRQGGGETKLQVTVSLQKIN